MKIQDLSDINHLSLYTIAEYLGRETETSLLVWLHRMAKANRHPGEKGPLLIKLQGAMTGIFELLTYLSENLPAYEEENLDLVLDGVRVDRDDFCAWWVASEYGDLPLFWFPNTSSSNDNDNIGHSLEIIIQKEVTKAFWQTPESGYNRPLKSQIIDWILKYYSDEGISKTAAGRIIKATWPAHIPKQGNLPHNLKPFPDPPPPR